jgi:hypothetical protein
VVVHDAQPFTRIRRRRKPHPAAQADSEGTSPDRSAP